MRTDKEKTMGLFHVPLVHYSWYMMFCYGLKLPNKHFQHLHKDFSSLWKQNRNKMFTINAMTWEYFCLQLNTYSSLITSLSNAFHKIQQELCKIKIHTSNTSWCAILPLTTCFITQDMVLCQFERFVLHNKKNNVYFTRSK